MNQLNKSFLSHEYLKLSLSSVSMILAVFILYISGLAIGVPFLLIGVCSYYEILLLNDYSKNIANEDDGSKAESINYLLVGNFILNGLVPGIMIQLIYFFFYYYSTDLSPVVYDLLSFLKANVDKNNFYFIDLYQSLPLFGFKKDFIFMRGEESVFIYNSSLFFLFYFVTMATFIVGFAGALLKINNKSYSKLAKNVYAEKTPKSNLENTQINSKSVLSITFQTSILGIIPIYLAWKFQQPIFDLKRGFGAILLIYAMSPMLSMFFYNFLSRLKGINDGR